MKLILVLTLLTVLSSCLAKRNAKLFFATISSSTSTSTSITILSTTSFCYATAAGAPSPFPACTGKKRKRRLAEYLDDSTGKVAPSHVQGSKDLSSIADEKPTNRDARFFFFSTSTSTITATATTTSTTYTAFLSVTVNCKPSYSTCG